MTTDDEHGVPGGEFPDEAGYPDGEGTLDEGTGAYKAPDLDDLAEFADQDEEDVTGDD